MVLLQSNDLVWSISPEVFCSWFSFKVMCLCGALAQGCFVNGPPSKVMFLCGALAHGCSVDGPSSKISFCVEHYPRGVL
jgi:hypothetical protein